MKLIIGALLIVALGTACVPGATSPSPIATSTSVTTVAAATATPATTTPPSPAPATSAPVTPGTITGFAGYPAEGHPAMTIYAVSTTDRSIFFSVEVPRAQTPPKSTYTITGVRPGTYNLFAYLQGNDGPAGGAYTEFVKCGLRAGCPSHAPIDVTVRAGETVREIDVTDWYAPPDTFPTRPR